MVVDTVVRFDQREKWRGEDYKSKPGIVNKENMAWRVAGSVGGAF